MSALEPQDLGIGSCAVCDHTFGDGDRYYRGIARGRAGLMLYIVCEPCAQHLFKNTAAAEKFSDHLLATLNAAALAGTLAGGRA